MFTISSKKVILFGLASSLLFEVFQYLFAIGGSDITDIMANTLGTIGGVCLYVLLRRIFSNKRKVDRLINGIAIVALICFGALTTLLILAN
jgi:glycopeptide antibiotics resistance protein